MLRSFAEGVRLQAHNLQAGVAEVRAAPAATGSVRLGGALVVVSPKVAI
jgi:hypothetical protein